MEIVSGFKYAILESCCLVIIRRFSLTIITRLFSPQSVRETPPTQYGLTTDTHLLTIQDVIKLSINCILSSPTIFSKVSACLIVAISVNAFLSASRFSRIWSNVTNSPVTNRHRVLYTSRSCCCLSSSSKLAQHFTKGWSDDMSKTRGSYNKYDSWRSWFLEGNG